MRFALSQRLASLGFGLQRESFRPIRVRVPGTPSVVVSVEMASDEEQYLRPRVLAAMRLDVEQRWLSALGQVSKHLEATTDGPPASWSSLSDLPLADRVLALPMRAWLGDIEDSLKHAALKAIEVLRWRIGDLGPVSPFDSSRLLSWELDGLWYTVQTDVGLTFLESSPYVRFTRRYVRDIQRALNEEKSQPIGHELLREAWGQRRERPRSAVLIGVAALELGVKEFVAEMAPDTEWLVVNAPSPPVVKMIWTYLPLLKAPVQFRPPKSRRRLQDAVRLRNELAHSPSGPQPSPRQLTTILEAIREVLWALDAARGYEWAEQYAADPPVSPWKFV